MDKIREGVFIGEALELVAIERVRCQIFNSSLSSYGAISASKKLFWRMRIFKVFCEVGREFHQMLLAFTGFKKLT